MTDLPEKPTTSEQKVEGALDRRDVLREFVRTGKYAAPIATVMLFGSKDTAAMMPSDPDL